MTHFSIVMISVFMSFHCCFALTQQYFWLFLDLYWLGTCWRILENIECLFGRKFVELTSRLVGTAQILRSVAWDLSRAEFLTIDLEKLTSISGWNSWILFSAILKVG
jgi:hypothetical protein